MRVVKQRLQAAPALFKCQLRPLAIGQVQRDPTDRLDLSGGVRQREVDHGQIGAAVWCMDLSLKHHRQRRLDNLLILIPETASQILRKGLFQSAPDNVVAGPPPEVLPGTVDQPNAAFSGDCEDRRGVCRPATASGARGWRSTLPPCAGLVLVAWHGDLAGRGDGAIDGPLGHFSLFPMNRAALDIGVVAPACQVFAKARPRHEVLSPLQ